MILVRLEYGETQTLGYLIIPKYDMVYRTIELPWKDNQRNISCIPEGEFNCRKRSSQKYGDHIYVMDVPGRSNILIHPANFVRQLEGCIAPGLKHADIDGDGKIDVVNSKVAMDLILSESEDYFELVVTSVNAGFRLRKILDLAKQLKV